MLQNLLVDFSQHAASWGYDIRSLPPAYFIGNAFVEKHTFSGRGRGWLKLSPPISPQARPGRIELSRKEW